ncbi:MAG: hypothetical protein ACI39R_06820 [Lachnospiraceae bacterium]
MAKVSISTQELRNQAQEISAVRENLCEMGLKVLDSISLVKDGLDAKLEYNMLPKFNSVYEKLMGIMTAMNAAYNTANDVANAFEQTDKNVQKEVGNIDHYLKNNYAGYLSEDAIKAPDSNQIIKPSAVATISQLTDGKYHTYPGTSKGYDYDCYSYAKWVFYQMYGTVFGAQGSPNWKLSFNNATKETASISALGADYTKSNLLNVLSKAQSGDVIQVVWKYYDGGSPHTMIFKEFKYDTNGNITGIYTLEGNNTGYFANSNDGLSGKYGRQHYYSIDDLYNIVGYKGADYGGGGLSVNHANNYDAVFK